MKNKIRFEDLTHFILLFLMFLSFTTIFLSMKNNDFEKNETTEELVSVEDVMPIDFEFENGRKLFRANCGSCHSSDMVSDLTGPALGGVSDRWAGKGKELNNWIKNSAKYLAEHPNDKYARKLSKKYSGVMLGFPNLNEEEIENILAYIETVYNQ